MRFFLARRMGEVPNPEAVKQDAGAVGYWYPMNWVYCMYFWIC